MYRLDLQCGVEGSLNNSSASEVYESNMTSAPPKMRNKIIKILVSGRVSRRDPSGRDANAPTGQCPDMVNLETKAALRWLGL